MKSYQLMETTGFPSYGHGGVKMSVAGVNAASASYTDYEIKANSAKTKETTSKTEKNTAGAEGAVYEKTSSSSKGTYSIQKMSSEDRAALVEKMKQDLADRQSQLLKMVNNEISKQGTRFGQATFGQVNDDFWKFLAKGDYTVDAATKEEAQKDISEDGYFGVKQTAQRLFDFANLLAGDDVEKMKKMQDAVAKGFKQAQGSWGGELPSISKDTLNAVNQMFDDYYNSKNTITEEQA